MVPHRTKSIVAARAARAIFLAMLVAVPLLACAAARGQEPPTYRLTPVDSGVAGSYVVTRSVNERGEIAGQLSQRQGGARPVLWTPTGGTTPLRDFSGLPAVSGQAIGINDLGQVAGTVNGRAAFWTSATGAANAAAADPSFANDINNAGVVIGGEILNNGADGRGFRRLADGTLQYLPGGGGLAVNSAGYVSGLTRTNPFVWAPDGTVTPLQGLSTNVFGMAHRINDSNWVVQLTNAFDVNDRGQVVGQGLYQGQLRGFLLTPVPEPAGALAIATLAGGFILRRRRKTPHDLPASTSGRAGPAGAMTA